MWRPGKARTSPGKVTVRELAKYGLDQHPRAIAVYWPDSQAVVCRKHATSSEQVSAMTQVRPDTDEATLLIGGGGAARQLHRECVLCP